MRIAFHVEADCYVPDADHEASAETIEKAIIELLDGYMGVKAEVKVDDGVERPEDGFRAVLSQRQIRQVFTGYFEGRGISIL